MNAAMLSLSEATTNGVEVIQHPAGDGAVQDYKHHNTNDVPRSQRSHRGAQELAQLYSRGGLRIVMNY